MHFQVGKLADLVLWNPALFGAKPEIVVKGGQIAWSQMGNYMLIITRKYFYVSGNSGLFQKPSKRRMHLGTRVEPSKGECIWGLELDLPIGSVPEDSGSNRHEECTWGTTY